MSNQVIKKQSLRTKRAMRVRKKLRGSSVKPRLSVHKSNRHILAQLIDDESGVTLGMAGTSSKELAGSKKNKESAKKVGEKIAQIAKDNNVTEVIFDRGPFKYHGILAELANAARANGLKF